MCGIAGEFVFQSDRAIADDIVVPMISVLAHRGPDEWGYYVDAARRAMLLHSRLSVVDLERGRQPLSNEDKTVWVTLNGEIYDFQRIAEELRHQGHRFHTRSDTEVIVRIYEEYGERFVEHLRGEFAFALYDQRQATLFLVRDRFGIKPLYYSVGRDSIVFASEMKALFRHPQIAAEFDYESVHHTLCSIHVPSATIFKNVHQVEPGCFLRVNATNGIHPVKYWDLPSPADATTDGTPARREQDIQVEFRGLLEEAVRLRLQGDVETGVYLSGGIDSASIAAIMAKLSNRPVKAFTVGFADAAYNETASARDIAIHTGLDHQMLQIPVNGLASHFVRSLWHTEAPVWNSHVTAKSLLSELAQQHLKVVLSGEGADELLLGYAQFKHQLLLEALRQNRDSTAARQALKQFVARAGILAGITASQEYKEYDRVTRLFGCYPYPVLRALVCQEKFRLLFSRSFRRRMKGSDPVAALATHFDRLKLAKLPAITATQYVVCKTDLPGYVLSSVGDRVEMAHSVESRTPFLDHKLAEFVSRLPVGWKLNEQSDKYILRRAVADLLPENSVQRPKHVFLAPASQTLGLEGHSPIWDRYFSRQFVDEVGIFDASRLSFIRRALRYLPINSMYHHVLEGALVMVLSLHVIHDLFCRNFTGVAGTFSRSRLSYSLNEGRVA